MKYKIGDIVVYTEEFTRFAIPTRYVVKDIVTMSHCIYYETYIDGDRSSQYYHATRVSVDAFEKTTMLDKRFLRDTKLNQLGI